MNDHHDTDSLNDFIDRYRRGEHPRPASADTRFAAQLLDLTARTQPDAHFVDVLAARLTKADTASNVPYAPVSTPSANGHVPRRPTLSRRQPAVLTWVAVLALVMLLGGLMLYTAQPDAIRLQPAVVQAATATPTPVLIPAGGVSPLPLLTGGFAQDDPPTFDRMWRAGLRWAGLSLEYRAADADTILEEARAYIETARAHGLGVLVSLTGTADEITTAQEDDYAALANFAGRVAALGPMAIEVWPEANLDRSWPDGKIGGGSYTLLLRPTYEAIKAANPDIWVISGAPAPTGAEAAFPGQVMNDDRFYAEMAEAGAATYADCIGVQYTQGIISPMATTGDPRDDHAIRYLMRMLQRAATPFRETRLPLCVTELGYLSPEGLPGELSPYFAWANETSVEEQAQWLADSISNMAMLSSVRVALVMIWRVDALPYDYNMISPGYAIIRPDGDCPACDEIGKLQRSR